MAKPSYVLNLTPQHKFTALAQWPEAQLLLLVPQKIWARARAYVPQFEEVRLAGRFGADPGDFEWELLDRPQGFKWWKRVPVVGDAFYFGLVVTPNHQADPLEAYGLIDIAADTPWWYDAVEFPAELRFRGEVIARERNISPEQARMVISLEEYRRRQMLTAEPSGVEPAWRIGDENEVGLLKNALIGLFDRARTATLAEEV